MRVYDQGAFVRVTVSYSEVYDFRRNWPASGLPDRGISFTFDQRNGDLVDLHPHSVNGAAVNALADDAKAYAVSRMPKLNW